MGLCKHRKPWLPEQLGVGYPGHPHPPGYWGREGIAGAGPWGCFLLPCVSSLCPQLLMPSCRALHEGSMGLEPTGSTGSTGVKAAPCLFSSLRSTEGTGSQELHLSPPATPVAFSVLQLCRGTAGISWPWDEFHRSSTGVRNPQGSWNCTPSVCNPPEPSFVCMFMISWNQTFRIEISVAQCAPACAGVLTEPQGKLLAEPGPSSGRKQKQS